MAFPHNLPLPIDYEGRYFGIDTPVNAAAATPEIQRRLDIFRSVQAEALNVSPENLPTAIAQKRAQARLALLASFQAHCRCWFFFWAGSPWHFGSTIHRAGPFGRSL